MCVHLQCLLPVWTLRAQLTHLSFPLPLFPVSPLDSLQMMMLVNRMNTLHYDYSYYVRTSLVWGKFTWSRRFLPLWKWREKRNPAFLFPSLRKKTHSIYELLAANTNTWNIHKHSHQEEKIATLYNTNISSLRVVETILHPSLSYYDY